MHCMHACKLTYDIVPVPAKRRKVTTKTGRRACGRPYKETLVKSLGNSSEISTNVFAKRKLNFDGNKRKKGKELIKKPKEATIKKSKNMQKNGGDSFSESSIDAKEIIGD
ncbi:hypothetical protein QE152_g5768 [Popillia japonica]|uniref:Uncharacterized protein n=1 Tax=Popillia japonica TaxID=7064 RepID=A0AAW1MLL2_POPJA